MSKEQTLSKLRTMVWRMLDEFVWHAREPFGGYEKERKDKLPILDLVEMAYLDGVNEGRNKA